ncbi:MAG: hypothetical protein NUV51_01330 [Sulfuricaulis sp.]|nr:hypothetical protein [Sulfuricaulis sp.]
MSKETEAKAWQDGYDAADRGVSESKNPYPMGSDERLSWNDGYMARDAEDENE